MESIGLVDGYQVALKVVAALKNGSVANAEMGIKFGLGLKINRIRLVMQIN